jgi:phage terminase large subunit-like protein
MREIEAAIASNRIHHDGNPVTSWCIGNVLGKEFSNGGLMPAKENKSNKIDAAVGLIMGVGRAMLGDYENIDDFLNDPITG